MTSSSAVYAACVRATASTSKTPQPLRRQLQQSLRHISTTTQPATTARSCVLAAPAASARAPIPHSITSRSGQLFPQQLRQTRPFSSTPRAQKCILNPRKDEDGNEMTMTITPRASRRLSEIARKDNKPETCLRISVESGGCHGFQYLMSLTTTDKVSREEDTLFEADDGTGAKVVLDEPSLELLKGSKVDYTMELIGSQFKIVDNPLATSSCGCGTSFDIKA
ncbi:[4Fe-4S] proteins maturation [Coniosporium apollinis]|uniref:[4Fe-4S] proteins maturation n=2 Tax=Coniosporium TaxID=2810619 RepID=A0ABQ9NMA6_9PEZI|nr:[4Fe-4S] proteins maturation [Cladosporium sp. JES 115]KAJ9659905.1 [4Fe-4S] proteins maturation [Coniosporium apollinis]